MKGKLGSPSPQPALIQAPHYDLKTLAGSKFYFSKLQVSLTSKSRFLFKQYCEQNLENKLTSCFQRLICLFPTLAWVLWSHSYHQSMSSTHKTKIQPSTFQSNYFMPVMERVVGERAGNQVCLTISFQIKGSHSSRCSPFYTANLLPTQVNAWIFSVPLWHSC